MSKQKIAFLILLASFVFIICGCGAVNVPKAKLQSEAEAKIKAQYDNYISLNLVKDEFDSNANVYYMYYEFEVPLTNLSYGITTITARSTYSSSRGWSMISLQEGDYTEYPFDDIVGKRYRATKVGNNNGEITVQINSMDINAQTISVTINANNVELTTHKNWDNVTFALDLNNQTYQRKYSLGFNSFTYRISIDLGYIGNGYCFIGFNDLSECTLHILETRDQTSFLGAQETLYSY
ncbi:MAG: hypothetical protein IKN04_22910 [Clostridia bacterium]|nr:hypothetical protein [Clostridia bacterium]MBR6184833.1 hypothetical protein [Clostridia bacterium]